jgi:hypothetical protein
LNKLELEKGSVSRKVESNDEVSKYWAGGR